MSDPTTLRARAGALHLHGLLAHWSEVATADRLRSLPGEQAQVDWGHFGHLQIGRAVR